jgi:hypothetical protein
MSLVLYFLRRFVYPCRYRSISIKARNRGIAAKCLLKHCTACHNIRSETKLCRVPLREDPRIVFPRDVDASELVPHDLPECSPTFSRIENFGFKSFALSAGGQTVLPGNFIRGDIGLSSLLCRSIQDASRIRLAFLKEKRHYLSRRLTSYYDVIDPFRGIRYRIMMYLSFIVKLLAFSPL